MTTESVITALLIGVSGGVGSKNSGLVKIPVDDLMSHCELLGGWTSQVSGTTRCGQPVVLFTDENALLNGRSVNNPATGLWHSLNRKHDHRALYGAVIVTGGSSDGSAYTDVPEPAVRLYLERWS